MRFGSSFSLCTGSLIGRSLVVTAAHCLWNYGTSTTANEVTFTVSAARARAGRGPGCRQAQAVPRRYPTTHTRSCGCNSPLDPHCPVPNHKRSRTSTTATACCSGLARGRSPPPTLR
jgi:hypothetical protein